MCSSNKCEGQVQSYGNNLVVRQFLDTVVVYLRAHAILGNTWGGYTLALRFHWKVRPVKPAVQRNLMRG